MRKLILAVGLFLFAGLVHADGTGDMVKATLLDHVTTVTQIKSGETKVAFLDSVILIGNYHGRSILDLQAGVSGETAPEPEDANGMNFIYGGFFKVSSLVRDYVKLADHWKFLNSVEYGVGYTYDTREKKDYVSLQLGLAFTLNPLQ